MSVFYRLHRHIDPGSTLGELLFGLIMVMTFTLGARLLGADEPTDGRELLIAAIGCNIAWGLIDAFLYLLGTIYERRRIANLQANLRTGGPDSDATNLIREELDKGLPALASEQSQEAFARAIVTGARSSHDRPVGLTASDFRAAALILALVVLTAVPAALPFLFIDDSYTALRVSNGLISALLFVVGYFWGKHVGGHPVKSGLLVMAIGVTLVLVAIPLGG
jgi:hypothetical protein